MSSSDPVPGRLVVRSPGAVLDVLDSWLEPLRGSGAVGELSLEVAPGAYQISARIRGTEKIQFVAVRPGDSIEIDIPVEFDAAAPVEGTTTANEAHGDLARDLTGPTSGRSATAASWRSSSLVLILRRLLDRESAPLPNTHAPFDLFDQRGRPVCLPTPTLARQVSARISPAVGWAVPLRPGGYRLRWAGPSGQPVEHAVWLSPGWQTLLFVPQGARGPYLPEMSVHLLRTGSSWDRHSPGWLAVEAAFAALQGTAAAAVDPRSADFVADADNPMLVLLTLHILGRARRAGVLGTALDRDLTERVEGAIRQLRRSLGWHPDVAALAELWSTGSGDRRRWVSSTPWPPLLADSLDLLLAAEEHRPKVIPARRVIPSRSLTEVVGGQRYASSPWLLWDPKDLPLKPTARRFPRFRAWSRRSPSRAGGVPVGTPTKRRHRMWERVRLWVKPWAKWWRAHRPWDRPLRVYRTAGRRVMPNDTAAPVAVERVEDLVGGVAHVLQISLAEAAKGLGTRVIAHRLGMASGLAKRSIKPTPSEVAVALVAAVSVFALYGMWRFWPAPSPATGSASPTANFSYFGWQVSLTRDQQLFVVVALAGVVGAMLDSLRSLSTYIGERYLFRSWIRYYLRLPFVGGILATIVYVVLRAGLLPGAGSSSQPDPYSIAAIGALVGLFSAQAAEKVKAVLETVIPKVEPGSQSVTNIAMPSITGFAPAQGPVGTPVVITGSNLTSVTGVSFTGAAAPQFKIDSDNRLTVSVPDGAATGPVTLYADQEHMTRDENFTVAQTTATQHHLPDGAPG